jgi:hypothetical protein
MILNVNSVLTKQDWRFRLQRTFFGLSEEYQKQVYEQFFILKYHGGWSFIEAYNRPIGLRMWFVERLAKQIKDEAEAMEKASKKR